MQAWIEKHFYLVNLLVIGLTATLSASVLTTYVESKLVGQEGQPPRRSRFSGRVAPAARKPKTPALRSSLYDVTRRNIFCSYCKAVKPSGPVKPGDEAPTLKLDDAELLATLMAPKDDRWSLATIRLKDGRTRVVAKGSKLGGAEIVKVESKRVTFRKGKETGVIELVPGADKPSSAARPVSPRRPGKRPRNPREKWRATVSRSVRKVGPNKYEIDRSLVNEFIANANVASRDAAIYPHARNGKADGYRLGRVRPGGIFAKLGLRSGDVVNTINNIPITSPDKLLSLYTKLPTASHMTIGISRYNKPLSIDYAIK